MELLSTRQLAEVVGVSESSIKRWVDRGKIAATRTPGGHRRIALPDALKFIREEGLPAGGFRADVAATTPLAAATSENLRNASLRGDLRRTQEILIGSWLAGRPVAQIWDDLVAPAMDEIGKLWGKGPHGIALEHVATDTVTQVASQLRTMVEATHDHQRLAVGCAPELDPYLLPSSAASTVLSDAGWRTANLGPMTPTAALLDHIKSQEPALVWVSFSREVRCDEIDQLVGRVVETSDNHLIVGGRGIPVDWESREERCTHGRSMAELAEAVDKIEHFIAGRRAAGRVSNS